MSTYWNLVREGAPLIAVFANLRSFLVVTIIFIIIKSKLAGVNRQSRIILFSLYVLFSHFRARDGTTGSCFFQMSSCARAYVCIMANITRISRGLNWENKTYKLKMSITSILMGESCIYISLNQKKCNYWTFYKHEIFCWLYFPSFTDITIFPFLIILSLCFENASHPTIMIVPVNGANDNTYFSFLLLRDFFSKPASSLVNTAYW